MWSVLGVSTTLAVFALLRASATSSDNPAAPRAPAPAVPCFDLAQGCIIEFEVQNLSQHRFSGFGADLVWPANSTGFAGFAPLHIKYLRLAEGAHSSMAALRQITKPLGIEWVLTKWSASGPWEDEHHVLTRAGVDGFAQYWVETVSNLSQAGLCPEHLDLMNEPDSGGQWSLGIPPIEYNSLVAAVRSKLDSAGLQNVSITGPGLAFLQSNAKWIQALDARALEALSSFSSHAWDDGAFCHGGSSCTLHQWPALGASAAIAAPQKPIWIEEFATKEFDLHGLVRDQTSEHALHNDLLCYEASMSSMQQPYSAGHDWQSKVTEAMWAGVSES